MHKNQFQKLWKMRNLHDYELSASENIEDVIPERLRTKIIESNYNVTLRDMQNEVSWIKKQEDIKKFLDKKKVKHNFTIIISDPGTPEELIERACRSAKSTIKENVFSEIRKRAWKEYGTTITYEYLKKTSVKAEWKKVDNKLATKTAVTRKPTQNGKHMPETDNLYSEMEARLRELEEKYRVLAQQNELLHQENHQLKMQLDYFKKLKTEPSTSTFEGEAETYDDLNGAINTSPSDQDSLDGILTHHFDPEEESMDFYKCLFLHDN